MKTLCTLILLFFCTLTFAQAGSIKIAGISKVEPASKDTAINTTKVELVNSSFDKLVNKLIEQKKSIWDILIPFLIGAGLTLFTQFSIELWKFWKERNQKKQELISKGLAKMYVILQAIRHLAMYKNHKQYYYRAHEMNTADIDSFNKHYDKGQEQRDTEIRLAENIAEYFQLATEYAILTKSKNYFQKEFETVIYYKHPQASNFKDCTTEAELDEKRRTDEARLNEEYKKFFAIFEGIQKLMK